MQYLPSALHLYPQVNLISKSLELWILSLWIIFSLEVRQGMCCMTLLYALCHASQFIVPCDAPPFCFVLFYFSDASSSLAGLFPMHGGVPLGRWELRVFNTGAFYGT